MFKTYFLSVRMYNNNLYVDARYIEIHNLVDIRQEMNYELSMRVITEVKNNDIFYTDLNGFQVNIINLYIVYFYMN